MQQTLLLSPETQFSNLPNGAEENESNPFLELIEAYDFPQPKRGDIIHGEILRIDEDVVFIDIGSKRDAMVPYREVEQLDEAFLNKLSAGDTVPVYVTQTPLGSDQLIVSLERGLQELDWERAIELQKEDTSIELNVVNYNKGGVVVEFGRIQGFVPNSHIPALQNVYAKDERTSHKSKMVDSTLHLKIIEIDPQKERFVLSAKAAQKEQRRERLKTLSVNDDVSGEVVNLKPYGAFVDIGDGIVGLLHISCMSWKHIAHPREMFSVGDEIEVRIDKIDIEQEKISLNHKVLLPNPWETFAEKWSEGDLLEGKVTAVVDFGAFVQVADGVEGLLHKNEMLLPTDGAPGDALEVGDKILVRIMQIDEEEERLSLSKRRVTAEEEVTWMRAKHQASSENPPLEEELEEEITV